MTGEDAGQPGVARGLVRRLRERGLGHRFRREKRGPRLPCFAQLFVGEAFEDTRLDKPT